MPDNFIAQQIGPKSDSPVKDDSPAEKTTHDISADKGENIFSALLLLALIGGKAETARTASPAGPSADVSKDNGLSANLSLHLKEEESGKPASSPGEKKVSSEFQLHEKFQDIKGLLKDSAYQGNVTADSKNSDGIGLLSRSDMMASGITGHVQIDSNCNNTQPLPRYINQESIMQQVSQRLSHSVHIGTHTARIRLQPKDLGDLQMKISVNDNSVNAVITVENSEVKGMIEANLNRLEEELKNQGLSVEQFSVEMKGGDLRDRPAPSFYREDRLAGRGFINEVDDNRIGKEGLNIPVKMDMGIVSIFA